MKRTQIQMPDALYDEAQRLAETKEISLAELVRRGLEYMLAISPEVNDNKENWELPAARPLHAIDPFADDNWREHIHTARAAAETRTSYGKKSGKRKS
jgi:hypothetical protein